MASSAQRMPTMKEWHYALGRFCEEKGWHHGVPIFSCSDQGHALILAKGSPLSEHGHGPDHPFTFDSKAREKEEGPADCALINAWRPEPCSVHVYRDSKGTFKGMMPDAHIRFKILLDTLIVRGGAVMVQNEFTAMEALIQKVNNNQWESYVLSGAFPETSKRSGVTYIFRKGLPTIAMRERKLEDGNNKREFLAALCLHPLAYFKDTFCGSYPPTDEVIAHLMLMRSDEHKFWAKANHHTLSDPLAGI